MKNPKRESKLLPSVFHDAERTFQADSCLPLVKAVENNQVTMEAIVNKHYPGKKLPDEVLPELCTVGYWNATKDQDWGLGWHRNEGIEITYLARGEVSFSVGSEDFTLQPGDLTVTRPWQRHRVGNPNIKAGRLYWLMIDVGVYAPHAKWNWPDWFVFSRDDLCQLTDFLSKNEQPVLHAGHRIGRAFESLEEVLHHQNPSSCETLIKHYINEVMIRVFEMLKKASLPLNSELTSKHRTVKIFLSELPRYISSDWDLPSMAAECGLARSQFSKYCQQITNRTPIEFLTDCRMEAAIRMLTKSDLPIGSIAGRCGFQSSRYFSTAFKNRIGVSPGSFRTRAG